MLKKGIPFAVNPNDVRTLVDQVSDGLRAAISTGWYRPGDSVPSSRELAPLLGVSRRVTKTALERLVREGFVISRPRIGSVVRDRAAKQWRGHVVFVCPEGDENYAQTVLAGALRDRLTEAGYLFTQVCLPQKSRDRYDFARLDVALAQSVDFIVTMFARPHILARLSKQNVPFAVFGEYKKIPVSAVGGTWLNFNLAMQDFAAACRSMGVKEVVQVYCWLSMGDAAPALRKVGVRVRKMQVAVDESDDTLIGIKRIGMRAFAKLIDGKRLSRDVVYLFTDDYLASGALAALSYAGLHSPEDVRIATFANRRLGPVYPRELTRMEFDAHNAGDILANAALEYLTTGRYPENSVVGPVWVDGETMGVKERKSKIEK